MIEKLEPHARQIALQNLEGWAELKTRDAISKTFRFSDFESAFSWMTHIALKAEEINHHPEWTNVYNRVDVILTTHDAGGVTALDVEMARHMNAEAGR